MTKCVICGRRPAQTSEGYCLNCTSKLIAQKHKREAQTPVKFLTYRGSVVGLYPDGDGGRTLVGRLLQRNPENLPRSKTLDLNTYLEGFTREQIKKMKAGILQLTKA